MSVSENVITTSIWLDVTKQQNMFLKYFQNDKMKTISEKSNIHFWHQIAGCAAASMICLNLGMAFGISGVLLPSLREDKTFPYDKDYVAWIASVTPLTMIIGCLTAGTLVEILGRKKYLTMLTLPILSAWLLLGFSQDSLMLLIARILTGISNGAVRPVTVIFIGEISDPKYRGVTLFAPTLAANVGALTCHIASKFVHWRTNIFICCFPAILGFLGLILIKESPLWLISRGRLEEGIHNFEWYRGCDENAQKELNGALAKQENDKEIGYSIKTILSLLIGKSFLKPLATVFLLFILTEYCGINTLTFYAKDILTNTFGDKMDAYLLMIVTDLIRASGALVVCLFGKFMPRKTIYFTCSFGTVSMLTTFVVFLYIDPPNLVWIPVSSLILFVGLSSPLLSLSWSFVAEIFPGKLRGVGSSLSATTSFLLLFTSIRFAPTIMEDYGVRGLYTIFLCVSIVCAITLSFLLPETNGLSLQDIEEMLNKKKKENKIITS